jgi:hypothetical protein
MKTMQIKTDDYQVYYEAATGTLNVEGLLRESGIADYKAIQELLDELLSEEIATLKINLVKLEFLNSSGMSVLSRFIINVRKKKTIEVFVKGLNGIIWQEKLFNNWKRLMPGVTVEWE